MRRPVTRGLQLALPLLPFSALAGEAMTAREELILRHMEQQQNTLQMLIMRGVPLLFVLAALLLALLYANHRAKRRNELLSKFIDKGQEIPAALLPQPHSRQRALRTGTLLVIGSLGTALGLLATFQDFTFVAWCLVPLFLGIGCFINAAFFYRDRDGR